MPRDADALAEGVHFFEQGDYGAALAWLQEIPDESPQRVDALLYIGRIYLAGDQAPLAEQCFRTVSVHMREPFVFFLLGESLLAQGQVVPAEAAFREALRRDPTSASGLVMLGRAVAAQGRHDEAIRAFEAAISRDAKLAAARFYLTDALLKKGDTLRAVGQLHYLLQLAPDYVPAIALKGDIAFRMKDYRQAALEYERARARGVDDAALLERLGHAYLALDDEPRALVAYDAAVTANAQAWEAYLWAGRVAQERGLPRRAARYYQAISRHPEFGAESREALQELARNPAARAAPGRGVAGGEAEEPLPDPGPLPDLAAAPAPAKPSGPKTKPFQLHESQAARRVTTTKLQAPLDFDDAFEEGDDPEPLPPPTPSSGPVARGLDILKNFLKQVQQPPR
ncbi:MAG: tetratricopeptide repeat protein [Candidatus Sericytochromatia bacterium]|nr:tetratricopeptide repeat protein [Candidatus Tanganyikabacteria bacterium]